MSQSIPPLAVLIAHRVANYDAWKTAFDKHLSARKEATCLGHHINRGADDPNMVYVYCPVTDAGHLKTFLDNPDLGDVMKDAGVEGEATIKLMKPMSADFIPDQKLAGIIVSHGVKDYDAWRTVYDGLDDHRKQSGIVGHAVNQELGDPNQVTVYHQAKEIDSLRAFVDSPKLKEAMQRGGVTGTPEISFVQVSDFADY